MHSKSSSSAPSHNPSKLTLKIYETEPDDAITPDGKRQDYLKALRWENAQCCNALQAANISPYRHDCRGQKKNVSAGR